MKALANPNRSRYSPRIALHRPSTASGVDPVERDTVAAASPMGASGWLLFCGISCGWTSSVAALPPSREERAGLNILKTLAVIS